MKGHSFPSNPTLFCVTDIGSTTTKALLYERDGATWRFHRAEAPTTVERPHEDVTVGVYQALGMLERQTGVHLLVDGRPSVPYYSTSSAGGGLAMVVTGLVRQVTSASAERVALGAGAILLDVLAMDDGRTPYEKIEALHRTRPDIVLLAGGFDGEALSGPVFLAELLREANLTPKHGVGVPLPVIYAGNTQATALVRETLGERYHLHAVPNIRPSSEEENLEPAREAIHSLFMHHVMAHAPGYGRLLDLVDGQILPTPAAFMRILQHVAEHVGKRILAVDIGGATTDVFSVSEAVTFRTVSANLGMSYSALNVVRSSGISTLQSFAPGFTQEELVDRIGNKHGNPTALPSVRRDLRTEWAVASAAIREAVREHLALKHGHLLSRSSEEFSLRTVLRGTRRRSQPSREELDLSRYDLLVGSGGILSHSRRDVAAMILLNALRPRHPIGLAVDRAFMFPHLGAIAEQAPSLALQLFAELGLVRVGHSVWKERRRLDHSGGVRVRGTTSRGRTVEDMVPWGTVGLVRIHDDEQATLSLHSGPGLSQELVLDRPTLGLIVDARDRDPHVASLAAGAADSSFVLLDEEIPSSTAVAPVPSVGAFRHGQLSERRELAVPGEVLVHPGQAVAASTVVARTRRVFRRPFFLDVARSLGIPSGTLLGHLGKHIGDEVVEQEELARVQRGPLRTKRYLSPVAGTIERLLPTGTLVVREPAERARQLGTATVASDLGLRPEQITPYLKVRVGQHVERGQSVAGILRPGVFRQSVAPVRGTVREINTKYGIIHIEPLQEELEVSAWLHGVVVEVSDRGCVVNATGTEITGFWGTGGEAHGSLAIEGFRAESITITRHATRRSITAAMEAEARGLVAGSAHLQDIWDLSPSFPVMVTVGFGDQPMPEGLWSLLTGKEGTVASINGTTSLRVGVQRPRLLIPDQ